MLDGKMFNDTCSVQWSYKSSHQKWPKVELKILMRLPAVLGHLAMVFKWDALGKGKSGFIKECSYKNQLYFPIDR